MSDVPSPPRNSVARFGVSFVGPTFTWAYAEPDPDGENGALRVVEKQFRAHPGLSFDEQLAYQRSLSMLQATAIVAQRRLDQALKEVGDIPEGEDPTPALEALADELAKGEEERWQLTVDQVVMLVAPQDRDEFRTLISQGNSADVRELKEHLVRVVVTREQKQVEVAGAVDPTSQPSSSG